MALKDVVCVIRWYWNIQRASRNQFLIGCFIIVIYLFSEVVQLNVCFQSELNLWNVVIEKSAPSLRNMNFKSIDKYLVYHLEQHKSEIGRRWLCFVFVFFFFRPSAWFIANSCLMEMIPLNVFVSAQCYCTSAKWRENDEQLIAGFIWFDLWSARYLKRRWPWVLISWVTSQTARFWAWTIQFSEQWPIELVNRSN